jgi:hypothetical protein
MFLFLAVNPFATCAGLVAKRFPQSVTHFNSAAVKLTEIQLNSLVTQIYSTLMLRNLSQILKVVFAQVLT